MNEHASMLGKLAMLRKTLDGEYVVDAHTHVGGLSKIFHLPDSSTDEMIAEIDRHGIDLAVTFPFASITPDYAFGNDTAAAAVSRYPDRLIGVACVNPHYSS